MSVLKTRLSTIGTQHLAFIDIHSATGTQFTLSVTTHTLTWPVSVTWPNQYLHGPKWQAWATIFWKYSLPTQFIYLRSNTIRTCMDTLQWRHNGRDDVSLNHQPHDCLLGRLFRRRLEKTSKFRVTGLCARNSPVSGELPTRRASNAENVSIWLRHHVSASNKHGLTCAVCVIWCAHDLTLYLLNHLEGTKTYIYISFHSFTLTLHR